MKFRLHKAPRVWRSKAGEQDVAVPGRHAMTAQIASPPKGAYRWLVLAAATLAQATASFALLGLAALAGFLQRDFGLSAAATGLLFTAGYVAPLLSLVFVGDLLDRKSERLIIGVGAVIVFRRTAARGAERQLRRAAAVPGRCRPRLQRDAARRQQIGLRLVSRRPARARHGHPPGRIAAWRGGGGGDPARRRGGLELARGVCGRRGGGARRRACLRADLSAAVRGVDAAPRRATLTCAAVAGLLRQPWMRNAMVAGLALVSAQYGILTWLMLDLRDRCPHSAHARRVVPVAGASRRRRRPRRSGGLE